MCITKLTIGLLCFASYASSLCFDAQQQQDENSIQSIEQIFQNIQKCKYQPYKYVLELKLGKSCGMAISPDQLPDELKKKLKQDKDREEAILNLQSEKSLASHYRSTLLTKCKELLPPTVASLSEIEITAITSLTRHGDFKDFIDIFSKERTDKNSVYHVFPRCPDLVPIVWFPISQYAVTGDKSILGAIQSAAQYRTQENTISTVRYAYHAITLLIKNEKIEWPKKQELYDKLHELYTKTNSANASNPSKWNYKNLRDALSKNKEARPEIEKLFNGLHANVYFKVSDLFNDNPSDDNNREIQVNNFLHDVFCNKSFKIKQHNSEAYFKRLDEAQYAAFH